MNPRLLPRVVLILGLSYQIRGEKQGIFIGLGFADVYVLLTGTTTAY